MKPTFFPSAAAFRRWLAANHAKKRELLLGFNKKGSGRGGITYPEALDEALCFGWIDGVRKGLDAERYTIRFSPRKKRSIWSQVNLRRMAALLKAGRVAPPGKAAHAQRDEARTRRYSFEQKAVGFSRADEKRFRANRKAWAFFQTLRPSERRAITWWVVSAKQEETRRRRLDALIASCARGVFDRMRPPPVKPR